MSRIVSCLFACFLIAVGFCVVIRYCWNSDHLSVEGTFQDLGTLYLGQSIRKTIPLENRSAETVEILRWAPSCRCLNVDVQRSVIAPHSSVSIVLQTSGSQPLGSKSVQVKIQWHYRGTALTREDSFSVGFKDISSLLPEYSTIDFGNVSDKSVSAFRNIRIWPGNLKNTWDGLELSSKSNALTPSETHDSAGAIVSIKLDSKDLKPGVFNSSIEIYPTREGKRIGEILTIPVHAKIPQSFACHPSVIQFPPSGCKQPLPFVIILRSKGLPISSVSLVHDPKLENAPKVKIGRSRAEAVIEGTLLGVENEGPFVGSIRIRINGSNLLEVPFFGLKTSAQANRPL